MCENYLSSVHEGDILRILENSEKDKYFSVNINFLELFESNTNLGNSLLTDPENSLKNWNEAVFNVQNNFVKEIDKKFTIKNNVNCRIYSLPPWPHVCRTIFPGNDDTDKFLQVTGTVVRMSARKLLEYQRQYICTKCKYPITVEAIYDKKNIIKQPKKCTNPEGCTGKNIITFGELDSYNCKDYQEIKIQEDLSKMSVGTIPGHMLVTLEDDLVNVCKPGENVTITGIVKRRWSEFEKGKKITVDIALKANHIQVNNSSGLSAAVSEDMKQFFDSFWTKYRYDPLVGRNIILKSISPEIYGRELVKLAMAIVLAGGSPNEESQISTGIDTRPESHLLLVGDPGTGKSQMLKFASKIVPRSVLTTGIGSTAAGLTVTAIMENGEWQLEAGALVMADGGICCIDEFNSMREHDRTSIHEAMEQQTISVAKAGMVCKLKTRCSVLAACNPKGNIDPSQPLCINVAMSSPLLSRFDLILLLRDIVNEDNDRKLADYVLNKSDNLSGDSVFWSLEKLQAYYAIIKKECPKLTVESETILSTYYQLQRKFGGRNKSRTTVRLLESLIRLSQGHAKLIYHGEVQVIDTIFAIILVDAALDYESSLLNLNIDYDSFFDNPEPMYRELLENILGKLDLDYIYHREVEKIGIKIPKISQNTSGRVSQSEDDTSPNLKDRVLTHAATSTPKRTQFLFSYRRQAEHEPNNLNISEHSNRGGSQGTELVGVQRSATRPQFLFNQKMRSKNKNSSQASQVYRDVTSSQSESELLYSQGKTSHRVPERSPEKGFNQRIIEDNQDDSNNLLCHSNNRITHTVNQDISNDSGNISHDFTNIFGEGRPHATKNINNDNQNFSIYHNTRDSFIRERVVLNLDEALSSKHTEGLDVRNNFGKNASHSLKFIQENSVFKNDNKKQTEKKNITLSEIVRSKSDMDYDFDLCLTNIKMNSAKPANKAVKNNSVTGDLSVSKTDEESGFGSTVRRNESGSLTKSTSEESMDLTKTSTTRKARSETKKTKTKSYNYSEITKNELHLLNFMPSVNDDLDIDWNILETDEHNISEHAHEVEDNNLECFGEKGTDILISDEEIKKTSFSGERLVTSDNNEVKKSLSEDINISNKHSENLKHGGNKQGSVKQSFADFLTKFEFVPREQREKENETNVKDKDNKSVKLNVEMEKEIDPKDRENDESGRNVLNQPKKFKFTNQTTVNKLPSFLKNTNLGNKESHDDENDSSSERLIAGGTELETSTDAKLNFKRFISNIDEEIKNFDFGSSIQNPFSRSLSNFNSKASSSTDVE